MKQFFLKIILNKANTNSKCHKLLPGSFHCACYTVKVERQEWNYLFEMKKMKKKNVANSLFLPLKWPLNVCLLNGRLNLRMVELLHILRTVGCSSHGHWGPNSHNGG